MEPLRAWGLSIMLWALVAGAWAQREVGPVRANPGVVGRVANLAAGRTVTDFKLDANAATFEWRFQAAREGAHTAAANWNALPAVQLTLSVAGGNMRPLTITGAPPLLLPYPAEAGVTYTVTIARREGGGDVSGQLAMLGGRGRDLAKRPPGRLMPMSAEALAAAGTPGVKDPVLPLIAALAERRLGGARDKNEFDVAFDRALSNHPAVTDAVLQRFVNSYKALPEATAAERFVPLRGSRSGTAAVSRADVERTFREAQRSHPGTLTTALKAVARLEPGEMVAVIPHIAELKPKAPLLGYARGTALTVVGHGFHPDAALNKVEMKAANPEKIGAKSYLLGAKGATGTELQVTLPLDMPSAKWLLTVKVGGKISNAVSFWTTNTAVPGAIPGPAITGFDPPGRQPSQQLLISGSHFQPGLLHRVTFENLDLPDGPSYSVDAKVLSTTQLQLTIPEQAIAGKHAVRVLIPGWPYSDAKTYDIAPPRYRVVFLNMVCDDESDPEWSGDDELVTMWTASGDAQVWAKNSQEYTGYSDGTVRDYSTGDAVVVPATGGGWAEVKWALAVNAQLYEWDAGDIKASQEFVGFVGEYGSYAASAAWGPEAGLATKLTAALISEAIGRFSSWLGGDPDSLGKRQIVYTGPELQGMLAPGSSINGVLKYNNSDDDGSYHLNYRIYRE